MIIIPDSMLASKDPKVIAIVEKFYFHTKYLGVLLRFSESTVSIYSLEFLIDWYFHEN
jgi:hypothetical protein